MHGEEPDKDSTPTFEGSIRPLRDVGSVDVVDTQRIRPEGNGIEREAVATYLLKFVDDTSLVVDAGAADEDGQAAVEALSSDIQARL